jgi:hypothetical protein
MYASPDETLAALECAGYFTDQKTATTVYLAGRLHRPIMLEGPAGAGKTELATSVSRAYGVPLLRLQCYQGINEEKAIGQYDKSLQELYVLLMSKSDHTPDWTEIKREVTSRAYFMAGPLLEAIEQHQRCVLLIDEIDKVDYAFEAMLLEPLSAWTLSIPKMGTVQATSIDDVIDKGLILFMSLNVNVNERAVTALGRMLLQNLQLMIGRRYSRAEEGEHQPFVSVIMDEFSPFAYENFAHILQTARGANVAFLFALQSAPQLLQVGRGFRNDVASAPNTTFMLRTKDEETAQYFLKASARVRQMRRSMHVQKKGVFNPEFEEGTEGSQTEIKDTLAQDEHIKKMPVGQMEILMTDPFRGTIHKHVHIKKAFSHWLPQVPMNVYPKLDTVGADSHGLNLSFPVPDLEEKRQRRRRK